MAKKAQPKAVEKAAKAEGKNGVVVDEVSQGKPVGIIGVTDEEHQKIVTLDNQRKELGMQITQCEINMAQFEAQKKVYLGQYQKLAEEFSRELDFLARKHDIPKEDGPWSYRLDHRGFVRGQRAPVAQQ